MIKELTKTEQQRIEDGQWTNECTNCGHFWLRDYSYPVRHCPRCGQIKPWADKDV